MLSYEKHLTQEEILKKHRGLRERLIRIELLFYPYFLAYYKCRYGFTRWLTSSRTSAAIVDTIMGDGLPVKAIKPRCDIVPPEGCFKLKPALEKDELLPAIKIVAQKYTLRMIYRAIDFEILESELFFHPYWLVRARSKHGEVLHVLDAISGKDNYKIRDGILKNIAVQN